jgi:hypothetical protein
MVHATRPDDELVLLGLLTSTRWSGAGSWHFLPMTRRQGGVGRGPAEQRQRRRVPTSSLLDVSGYRSVIS